MESGPYLRVMHRSFPYRQGAWLEDGGRLLSPHRLSVTAALIPVYILPQAHIMNILCVAEHLIL